MKIVQEWFKERNEKSIVGELFAHHPIDFVMIPDTDRSLRELREVARRRELSFIRRMKQIELPIPSEKQPVFFASKAFREGSADTTVNLCYLEDIQASDVPERYSTLCTDFAKIMGYFVADTKLTLSEIDSVLADILHEITFFGYTQEELTRESEALLASLEEAEKGETYTQEEVWAHLGIPERETDAEEEALEGKVREAEYAYATSSFQREVRELKRLLSGMASV